MMKSPLNSTSGNCDVYINDNNNNNNNNNNGNKNSIYNFFSR